MTDLVAQARAAEAAYERGYTDGRRRAAEDVAKLIDAFNAETRDVLLTAGRVALNGPEAAPSVPSEPTPEGIRADILDLESYAVTEDGRTIRYVLTGVQIPAGLTIGGFTFDPETGALGWTQNVRQPTGREIRDELLAYTGLGPRRCQCHDRPTPTVDAHDNAEVDGG